MGSEFSVRRCFFFFRILKFFAQNLRKWLMRIVFFYLGILSERMMGRVQTLCDGYFSISVARHFITIYFTLKNIKYKNIYIRLVVNFGPFLFNYGLRHFERYFLKLFPNFSCNFVASYFTLNRRLNDIKQ